MNFLTVTKDGGPESHVWAYWLVELKGLFSIALLRFEDGSRDAFHSHAFNSVSWILKGHLREEHRDGRVEQHRAGLRWIKTLRSTFHKVTSLGRTWVLTFRGPWSDTWEEYIPAKAQADRLGHGRVRR